MILPNITPHIQRISVYGTFVNRLSNWKNSLESLDSQDQETLLGASLSRLFTKLPLWISHPSNIGGFYGILCSIALILPYRFANEEYSGWLGDWGLHCCLLIVACFFLGLCSTIIVSISKRFLLPHPFNIIPNAIFGVGIIDYRSYSNI